MGDRQKAKGIWITVKGGRHIMIDPSKHPMKNQARTKAPKPSADDDDTEDTDDDAEGDEAFIEEGEENSGVELLEPEEDVLEDVLTPPKRTEPFTEKEINKHAAMFQKYSHRAFAVLQFRVAAMRGMREKGDFQSKKYAAEERLLSQAMHDLVHSSHRVPPVMVDGMSFKSDDAKSIKAIAKHMKDVSVGGKALSEFDGGKLTMYVAPYMKKGTIIAGEFNRLAHSLIVGVGTEKSLAHEFGHYFEASRGQEVMEFVKRHFDGLKPKADIRDMAKFGVRGVMYLLSPQEIFARYFDAYVFHYGGGKHKKAICHDPDETDILEYSKLQRLTKAQVDACKDDFEKLLSLEMTADWK